MVDTLQYKVLSEPMRMKIIQLLAQGSLTVNEIVSGCKSSKSNISQHLKVLKEKGLVSSERKGKYVFYLLKDEVIDLDEVTPSSTIKQNQKKFVNNIVMEDKFFKVVKALSLLEKSLSEKQDVIKKYEAFTQAMEAYIQKAYFYRLPHPKMKGDYLHFLTNNIRELGLPSLLDWSSGEGYPVIDATTGKIHSFWSSFLDENLSMDSEESRNVEEIFRLISHFDGDEREELEQFFVQIRHRISNQSKNAYLSFFEKKRLLKPFEKENYRSIYQRINYFFEQLAQKRVTLCPHCGSVLKEVKTGQYNCLHWRCNLAIQKSVENGMLGETQLDHLEYYVFTDWVTKFIRIPGIEEDRIGNKTKNIVPHYASVIMNPDFDRVDILIEDKGFPKLQGDVKDIEFPYILATVLNEYRFEKTGELDEIYVIVPRDTIMKSPIPYIPTVRSLLNYDKQFLKVVSEQEWYQVVRNLFKGETT